jgi:hypothetical protein
MSDSAATGRRTLTDERGAFAISVPAPGTYLIDVRSIGFRPIRQPISLDPGQTRLVDLALVRNSVSIAEVRVEGRRNCRAPDHIANSAAPIWDDVWAALSATALADQSASSRNSGIRYRRESDAASGQVLSESRERRVGSAFAPFTAANPRDLARLGFLHVDDDGNLELFAPDARTFLSPEFISAHCFALTRQDAGATVFVGLTFWPQRTWTARGIEGTFWLDAVTRELRKIHFSYPGLSRIATPALALGGVVEFARDKQGLWFVSRWYIRAPVTLRERRYVNWSGRRVEQEPRDSVAAISEEGGIVLRDFTRFASISGEVIDSASQQPLTGSRVEVLGTSITGTVDSAGRFLLDTLLPGNYRLRVTRAGWGEPRGIWRNQIVSVGEGERVEQRVRVPEQRLLARLLCENSNQRSFATSAVYAVARDEQSGQPLASRPFEFRWLRYVIEGASQAIGWRTEIQDLTTDSVGAMRSCQIPSRADVSIRAAREASAMWSTPVRVGSEFTVLEVRLDSAGQIRRVDGGIPLAVTQVQLADERGSWGGLKGVVVTDDSSAAPLAGVEVQIIGLRRWTRTGQDGRFAFDSMAAGVYVVSLRRIGFAPTSQVVSVATDEGRQQFRLVPLASVLQEILVTAEAGPPSIGLREFRNRQRLGLGKFIDPDDFERAGEMSLSALLVSRIQGFTFVPLDKGSLSSGLGIAARHFQSLSGGGAPKHCFAQVFVDGQRVSGALGEAWDVTQLKTGQIEAMEFYRGAAETPTQFSGPAAACGTVVIWTRRK